MTRPWSAVDQPNSLAMATVKNEKAMRSRASTALVDAISSAAMTLTGLAAGAITLLSTIYSTCWPKLQLRAPQRQIFDGIAWSTAAVAAQTRDRLRAMQLRWVEIATLRDVDTAEDWEWAKNQI